MTRYLNLGAGQDVMPGWVNLDLVKSEGIDVVHDLDECPWPFDDDEFDRILALDVFEHVDHPLEFVAEAWRILKVGGSLGLRSPSWDAKNSYRDPTHKRMTTENTFDYWVPGDWLFEKYGDIYARGARFAKQSVSRSGDNFEFVLIKIAKEE